MEKEIGILGKKIYLLTYGGPKFISEISEMLYGTGKKKCKQVNREIKTLVDDRWIKKVAMKVNVKDGRSFQRKYCYANSYPLYNEINKRLKKRNIHLDKEKKYIPFFKKKMNEKGVLKKFLDEKFRETVDMIVSSWNVKNPSFGMEVILDELIWECEYNLIIDLNKTKMYSNIFRNFHNHKEYLKWKEDRLQKLTSKCFFDPSIDAEYTEKYLGKDLMKKLRYLSDRSRLITSHLFSMAQKIEVELRFLFEFYKQNENRMNFDIDSYFEELYGKNTS